MVAPTPQFPVPTDAALAAPAIPLPPPLLVLSAEDRPLLLRILTLKEDFEALAAELAAAPAAGAPVRDLLDLLAWSTRPDIAAWIAYFRQTKDQQRRTVALDALESIVKAPENKTELRRAATTLLRALDHRWPRERAAGRSSSDRPPARNALGLSPALIQSAERLGERPAHGTPPEPPPELDLPPPTITPDLAHTPADLARPIFDALKRDDIIQAIAEVRSISNNRYMATDDQLLIAFNDALPLADDARLCDPVPIRALCDIGEAQEVQIATPRRAGIVILHFTRQDPQIPWGLTTVDTT